jgi:neutral ceramidase
MLVGTASKDITPSGRITIAGQMNVRYGEYTHDPLTINAVAFKQGDCAVVIVSCDVCLLLTEYVRGIQKRCEKELGIPGSSVIIACTHTHLGPCTAPALPGNVEPEFMSMLGDSLVDVVRRSLADMEEVTLYAGTGWIDEMGFNRRGMHSGGKADMYYGSWLDEFEGTEGPRDGQVGVVFGRRENGDIKFVMPNFSTHPNSIESECFYSADLVGAVRSVVRAVLGDNVEVCYLTGAAGNTAPSQLENNESGEQPWRGEEGWKRSGLYLGGEILKVVAKTVDPMPDPTLRHLQRTLNIPIRQWPDTFDIEATFSPEYYTKEKAKWPELVQTPEEVCVNVVRIGDAILCTVPAELFVEHGLAMKQSSPAGVTLVSELADGYVGYVPTEDAFSHGGYETWPASSSRLIPDAGRLMAETIAELQEEAFTK